MNYKHMLIKFMERKASRLGKDHDKYFGYNDLIAITKWSERWSKKIFERLVDAVNEGTYGLNGTLCPFCQRHLYSFTTGEYTNDKNCSSCAWGQNHGKCHSTNNDYVYLSINKNTVSLFSRSFYRQTIKDIIKEEEV